MKKAVIAGIVVLVFGGAIFAATKSGFKKASPNSSSQTSASNTTSQPANPNEVIIKDFAFGPKKITIKKGTKITWTNQDDARHDVTPDQANPDFIKSKLMAKGESYSFTFEKVGTYAYHCTPHPYMKAVVEVIE